LGFFHGRISYSNINTPAVTARSATLKMPVRSVVVPMLTKSTTAPRKVRSIRLPIPPAERRASAKSWVRVLRKRRAETEEGADILGVLEADEPVEEGDRVGRCERVLRDLLRRLIASHQGDDDEDDQEKS
jgi:hypothetical protein